MLPSKTATCQQPTVVPSWKERTWKTISSLPARRHSLGRSNPLPLRGLLMDLTQCRWRHLQEAQTWTCERHRPCLACLSPGRITLQACGKLGASILDSPLQGISSLWPYQKFGFQTLVFYSVPKPFSLLASNWPNIPTLCVWFPCSHLVSWNSPPTGVTLIRP